MLRRAIPLSLALCTMLCACATPINWNLTVRPCKPLVDASGLLKPTPGAPRPANDRSGELAAFGDRQTGQLDKSNADKHGAAQILDRCEAENAAAIAELKKRRGFRL
jgi:hypothetical protein